ncbi:MAG: hypothetical protein WKG03_16695 [Telluria sp.]
MRLNTKQTAMILAGLRLLQLEMESGTRYMPEGIVAILDDADVGEGAISEIDELCEIVNVAPTAG